MSCYLPVKCLRAIVFLGSIFSIAISIALLALTIYVQVEKKEIISATNKGATTAALVGLYLGSILFLLLGVAGLSGSMKTMSKKESKGTCLLGLFSIGVMVFFLLFLGAAIFFFVGPQTIFGADCTKGSKTTLVDELYETSNYAYSSFCTADCPCGIKNSESELAKYLTGVGAVVDPASNKVKYGDCDNKKATQANIQIMSTFENLLKCGGWCDKGREKSPIKYEHYFYRFKDINDCVTKDCYENLPNCHDAFEDFMSGSGRIVGFGCLGAVLICLINIIAVCCICCHPSKVGRGSNFYSRMIEMD